MIDTMGAMVQMTVGNMSNGIGVNEMSAVVIKAIHSMNKTTDRLHGTSWAGGLVVLMDPGLCETGPGTSLP
jgi:hypothetical protein